MTDQEVMATLYTERKYKYSVRRVWRKYQPVSLTEEDLLSEGVMYVSEMLPKWRKKYPQLFSEKKSELTFLLSKSLSFYFATVCYASFQNKVSFSNPEYDEQNLMAKYGIDDIYILGGKEKEDSDDDFLSRKQLITKKATKRRLEWLNRPLSLEETSELKKAWLITMEVNGMAPCRFCNHEKV